MPRLAKPAFPTIGALRIVAGAALGAKNHLGERMSNIEARTGMLRLAADYEVMAQRAQVTPLEADNNAAHATPPNVPGSARFMALAVKS
jgi:hypothetical protein